MIQTARFKIYPFHSDMADWWRRLSSDMSIFSITVPSSATCSWYLSYWCSLRLQYKAENHEPINN